MSFDGKIVAITGAAGGTARRFAGVSVRKARQSQRSIVSPSVQDFVSTLKKDGVTAEA